MIVAVVLCAGVAVASLLWAILARPSSDVAGAALARQDIAGARAGAVSDGLPPFVVRLFGLDGLGMSRARAAVLVAAGTFAILAAVNVLTGMSIAAVGIAAAVALVIPREIASVQESARRTELDEAISEALLTMRDLVSGGMAVEAAMRQMRYSGPAVMREHFQHFADDLAADGVRVALSRMQERVSHSAWDMTMIAVDISISVGGSEMADMLTRRSDSVATALAMQRRAGAEQAQLRWTARIVLLALFGMVGFTAVSAPETAAQFTTTIGQIMLCVVFALGIAGYAQMLAMARNRPDPRVLRALPSEPVVLP